MEEKTKITNIIPSEKKSKKKLNKTEEIPNKIVPKKDLNLEPENFYDKETIYKNKELNIFKDEILTYLRTRDYFYMEKFNNLKIQSDKNERNFDNLNEYSLKNFGSLMANQTEILSKLDKLNTYDNFMNKTNDKLVSHDIRINCIREDLTKNVQKYDKIYLDNLEVPGYIGRCSKYPNCKIFFTELIKEIDKLNTYREKNTLDLCTYKDRLENIIKTFQSLVENNNDSQIKYISKLNDKTNKTLMDALEEKLNNVRLDNSQFALQLVNKSNELNDLLDKMKAIRDHVLSEFSYKSEDFVKKVEEINKSFDLYKVEYATIRKKFLELAEFIKNGKYSKTFANLYGKKEVNAMSKKLMKESKEVIEAKDVNLLTNIEEIEKMEFKSERLNTNKNNNNPNDKNDNNAKNNIIERMSKSQNNFNINKNKKKRNFGFMRDIEKNIMAYPKEKSRNSIDDSNNLKVHQGGVFYIVENKTNLIKKQSTNISHNDRHGIKGRKNENENIVRKSNEDLEDLQIEKTEKDEKNSSNYNNYYKDELSMSESYLSNINNSIKTFSTTNDKNNSMNSLINLNPNKNCNKFNLLEDDSKNNDKIIKELASELEQSTAKVNKLASNKKEIEENFKNICDKIQPINLKLINPPLEQIPEQNNKEEKEINTENKENINIKEKINTTNLIKEEINPKDKKRYSITSKSELNTTILTKNENNNTFSLNNNIINNVDNNNNNNKKSKDIKNNKSKIILESKDKNDDNNSSNKLRTSTAKSNRGKIVSKLTNSSQNANNDTILLNETINTNIDKKLNVYDKKLGDLESFTREQIYEILKQLSLIKKAYSFVAGIIKKDKFPNNNMRLSGHNTSHNIMGSGGDNFFNNYVNNENKNTMNITGNNFHRKSIKNDSNNKASNNGKIIQTMDDINLSDNLFYNGKYYFNIKDILDKYKNNINLNIENKKLLKKLENKLQEDSNRNKNNSPKESNTLKGDKWVDLKRLGKSINNKMQKPDNDSMINSLVSSEKK